MPVIDFELIFGTILLLGVIFAALAALSWASYEIWSVWTNHEPITGFIRGSLDGHPWRSLVLMGIACFASGMLIGHFSWHS